MFNSYFHVRCPLLRESRWYIRHHCVYVILRIQCVLFQAENTFFILTLCKGLLYGPMSCTTKNMLYFDNMYTTWHWNSIVTFIGYIINIPVNEDHHIIHRSRIRPPVHWNFVSSTNLALSTHSIPTRTGVEVNVIF